MTYGWDDRGRGSSIKGVSGDSCYCIGPQPGYPRCPCQMRGLIQRNGRWIQPEKDVGPVSATAQKLNLSLKEDQP